MKSIILKCSLILLLTACGGESGNETTNSGSGSESGNETTNSGSGSEQSFAGVYASLDNLMLYHTYNQQIIIEYGDNDIDYRFVSDVINVSDSAIIATLDVYDDQSYIGQGSINISTDTFAYIIDTPPLSSTNSFLAGATSPIDFDSNIISTSSTGVNGGNLSNPNDDSNIIFTASSDGCLFSGTVKTKGLNYSGLQTTFDIDNITSDCRYTSITGTLNYINFIGEITVDIYTETRRYEDVF